MFWTPVHYVFSTCQALQTWFELSRVRVYRNYLKPRKQNFFQLLRVRVIEGKFTVNGIKEFQGNRLVRVSEGSSYRESTVFQLIFTEFWLLDNIKESVISGKPVPMFSKTLSLGQALQVLQDLPIYLYLKKFRNFMSERPRQPPKHKSPNCISTEIDIYFNSWTKFTP